MLSIWVGRSIGMGRYGARTCLEYAVAVSLQPPVIDRYDTRGVI